MTTTFRRTKPKPPKMKSWEGWCLVNTTTGEPVYSSVDLYRPSFIKTIERLARVRVTEITPKKKKAVKRAGK